MSRLIQFNKVYFIWAVGLFIIEVLIAVFVHDQVVRPYIGDLLVVVLIYCFVKSFLNTPVFQTCVAVLIFAWIVEAMQYFNIINKLGLQGSPIARTIIGTSFGWIDIVAYTGGIVAVLSVEKSISGKRLISKL